MDTLMMKAFMMGHTLRYYYEEYFLDKMYEILEESKMSHDRGTIINKLILLFESPLYKI